MKNYEAAVHRWNDDGGAFPRPQEMSSERTQKTLSKPLHTPNVITFHEWKRKLALIDQEAARK